MRIRIDKLIGWILVVISLSIISIFLNLFLFTDLIVIKIMSLISILIFSFPLMIGTKLIIYEPVNRVSAEILLRHYSGKVKPMCISFSGIDGAGKTTHLYMLSKVLKDLGFKTQIFWMRWPAFTSYPLLLLGKLIGLTSRKGNFIEHKYYLNKAFSKVISLSLIYDFVLRYASLKILQKLLRWSLLLDRNILDLVVDLHIWTRERLLFSPLFIHLYGILLKDCTVIIFDVDERTALLRKKDTFDVPYLRAKRKLYSLLSELLSLHTIDTTQSDIHLTFTSVVGNLGLQRLLELYVLIKTKKTSTKNGV
jgi:hypothetical protein